MDYAKIYTDAFNIIDYSKNHHIQYDYVIEQLKKLYATNDIFELIDIGSGRGHLIGLVKEHFPNAIITSVDLHKFHDNHVDYFIECNLMENNDRVKLLGKKYNVLVCTDVLEHLDKRYINEVFQLFYSLADKALIAIANHSDILNGVELHTIQESDIWWDNCITKYYKICQCIHKYDGILYMYNLDTT